MLHHSFSSLNFSFHSSFSSENFILKQYYLMLEKSLVGYSFYILLQCQSLHYPQIHMLKCEPPIGRYQEVGFWGWWGHEGGTLLMESGTPQRAPCPPLPSEDTARRWTRKYFLTWPSVPWFWTSSLHSVRNKFSVVQKPPSLWYFITAASTDWDTYLKQNCVFFEMLLSESSL